MDVYDAVSIVSGYQDQARQDRQTAFHVFLASLAAGLLTGFARRRVQQDVQAAPAEVPVPPVDPVFAEYQRIKKELYPDG